MLDAEVPLSTMKSNDKYQIMPLWIVVGWYLDVLRLVKGLALGRSSGNLLCLVKFTCTPLKDLYFFAVNSQMLII